MKVLIVGCGKMGTCIAYDLICNADVDTLILADKNANSVFKAVELISEQATKVCNDKFPAICGEPLIGGMQQIHDILSREHIDVIVSAADYSINYELTKLAIEFSCHYIDLGGNNDVANRQMELDKEASGKGISIVINSGLAPGLANWIADEGIGKFQRKYKTYPDTVKIYVGGLPQNPIPPLNYKLVFSAKGLINEYIEPCTILRNGEIISVDPLTEVEDFYMMYKLEAFHTSGGSSDLPERYKGRVKNLEYKTIRYPGHANIIAGMKQLGLFSDSKLRSQIEKSIENTLTNDDTDLVLMRIVIKNDEHSIIYELADYHDPVTGFSAMARCTGIPTAIMANLMYTQDINHSGIVNPMDCVPGYHLMEYLEKRNIRIVEKYV